MINLEKNQENTYLKIKMILEEDFAWQDVLVDVLKSNCSLSM